MREFVLNSRHPDPRRVWKGGPEGGFGTPDPLDPLDPEDPEDPRMSSKNTDLIAIRVT